MAHQKKKPPTSALARVERLLRDHPKEPPAWRIFKIMGEFVSGFEFLRTCDRAVSFFGTARESFNPKIYKEATKLAELLSKDGFAVITGGGPGVMEAANRGAYNVGGRSIGIDIRLPKEQRKNSYVKESVDFKFFFVRKVMLSFASQVYIFFPGGFGTLDELFEMLTLIQTKKIDNIPIILVGEDFWSPLTTWIKEELFEKNKAIDTEDLKNYHVVSGADRAYKLIKKLVKGMKKSR